MKLFDYSSPSYPHCSFLTRVSSAEQQVRFLFHVVQLFIHCQNQNPNSQCTIYRKIILVIFSINFLL